MPSVIRYIIILICFFCDPCWSNDILLVQDVLDKLYTAHGDYTIAKPTIAIVNDDNNAALYLRRSNKIEISTKAVQVCKRYHDKTPSALAFIIGHELSHAFEINEAQLSTSFLAYDRPDNAHKEQEKWADINGLFISYLAGFDTERLLSELIKDIYQEFDLNENLKGYPALGERQATMAEVYELTSSLIELFEISNELIVAGQYDLAYHNLKYVEQWYKGSEVYNNMALCQIHAALNISDANIDPYVYPFELSWSTRLKKPKTSRGTDLLSPEERRRYDQHLLRSQEYINKSLSLKPGDILSHINKANILIISRGGEVALDYIRLEQLRSKTVDNRVLKSKLEATIAIAYAAESKKAESKSFFSYLTDAFAGTILGHQAEANLYSNAPLQSELLSAIDCPPIEITSSNIDGVKLHRIRPEGTPLQLGQGRQVYKSTYRNSEVFIYENKEDFFVIQQMTEYSDIHFDRERIMESATQIRNGWLIHCDEKKLILRLDQKLNIVACSKYYH